MFYYFLSSWIGFREQWNKCSFQNLGSREWREHKGHEGDQPPCRAAPWTLPGPAQLLSETLRCWRCSALPLLTDIFKVLNKFQNPKSFLFFMGIISRFSGKNECLVMKYTSEFENYKNIFLNMDFLGVFVAVMRVITLVSWSPQDRQWAHTHTLPVTAF